MATVSFGNFPVDMTDPQFLIDTLDGEIVEDSVFASKTEIGMTLDNGTQVSITGKFVFTSEKAFLNSTVSGMEFLDGKGDLIMSFTGLPKLSFKKIINLSDDEILNLFSSTSLIINGSLAFDDHLIAETGNTILNGHGGNDILDGFTKNDVLNGGDGDDQLNGGGGKDTLNGGSGNDDLYGDAGNDTLTGGVGNDTFVFDTVLGKNNVDTLADFQDAGPVNTDEILLNQGIFSVLAPGELAAGEFQSGAGKLASSTGSAHIVYNTDKGNLYYDADASGPGKGILFAKLTGSPDQLDNTDFTVVVDIT